MAKNRQGEKTMSNKKCKFRVSVPVVIFQLLGKIYFVLSILLSIYFLLRCHGEQLDLQILCLILFGIGVLFYTAPYLWHVDFYKDRIVVHKLMFQKEIQRSEICKVTIPSTHTIQIWNEKGIVIRIDVQCENYNKAERYLSDFLEKQETGSEVKKPTEEN
jgi:hypothetical protein